MAGPAFAGAGGEARRADAARVLARVRSQVELPTDDWPYLYLKERGLSGFYLSMMAAVAVLALAGAFLASPDFRRSLAAGGVDWEMFLFGLAFLLLETRSVTAMNLAWGATWLTSAIVFFAVLTMVLLATFAVRAWSPPFRPAMILLVAALGAAYLLPESLVLRSGVPARLALSVVVVGVPIFLASVGFARVFEVRAEPGWPSAGTSWARWPEDCSSSCRWRPVSVRCSSSPPPPTWARSCCPCAPPRRTGSRPRPGL